VSERGGLNPALQNALDKFTLDVTAKAKKARSTRCLAATRKSARWWIFSPVAAKQPDLVGEPGVGKPLVKVALRIARRQSQSLKPVSVRTLDLGLLQAGAGVKGEFEQRLKNVIDAVQQSPVAGAAVYRRSAHHHRRGQPGGRRGCRQPAETGAGAWRTAYHRRHHLV
jgi:type VI secretion system protein VasG